MSTPVTVELPNAPLVTSRGETIIGARVVEKIATRAASEVDGVGGGANAPARAAAEVSTDTVTVDLTVSVLYPRPVATVTNEVRTQVIRRLSELCGLRATEVNIAVPALVAPAGGRRRRVE